MSQPPFSAHRSEPARFLALMFVALLSLGAGLGLREPSPPDEPRFVLAARTMVESGQWLFPHRGREWYAEKPPVFMWMQAGAYRLVHDWRWAFLLPSLIAALLTLWLTYDLTRRIWDRRAARHAALALFVCVQFGLQAKRGQIDMVLVALTTLSLWGLLRHLLLGPDRRALWLGMFAAGLGTVTKGVGFLPLLVLLPWALLRWRRSRSSARGGSLLQERAIAPGRRFLGARAIKAAHRDTGNAWPTWLLAGLAFLLGIGVWLVPMLVAVKTSNDPALSSYASEILFRQTGTRYANAWHHVKPAWYYLQVIATLWLPGALLLPWLLPAWWRRCRLGDARLVLLLGWALLVLLFFTASPGKREVYIFPALPALCVAAGPLLPALLRRRGVRNVLFAYLGALAVVACLLSLTALTGSHGWAHKLADQRDIGEPTLRMFAFWLLALGILVSALSLWLAWSGRRYAGIALVLATAGLWTIYGIGLAPTLDADSSARGLMRRVGARIGPAAQLGMVAWREQNLLQADRPVVDFGFKRSWREQWAEAGPWLAADPQRRWLFVLEQAISPCVDRQQAVPIGQSNRNEWVLVPGTAWRSGCVAPEPGGSGKDGD